MTTDYYWQPYSEITPRRRKPGLLRSLGRGALWLGLITWGTVLNHQERRNMARCERCGHYIR